MRPFRCSRISERNGSSRPATCGAEYSISPSAVFSRPVRHAVAVALAGLGAVLVVVAPERIPALRLQRLLDDQPRRQLDQLLLGRPARPDVPRSARTSDWRVRIEAGILFSMGCSLLAPAATGPVLLNPQQGCTPTKFPAILGLHLFVSLTHPTASEIPRWESRVEFPP